MSNPPAHRRLVPRKPRPPGSRESRDSLDELDELDVTVKRAPVEPGPLDLDDPTHDSGYEPGPQDSLTIVTTDPGLFIEELEVTDRRPIPTAAAPDRDTLGEPTIERPRPALPPAPAPAPEPAAATPRTRPARTSAAPPPM
jgi:hypothetical protein